MADVSTTWAEVIFSLTLKRTSAQAFELTSVSVTNSSFQNYTHPDDHTRQTTDTPGFKPLTKQQFVLILRSPGQARETNHWYSRVQTMY